MKYYRIKTDEYNCTEITTPKGQIMENVLSCDIHLDADLPTATIRVLNTKLDISIPESNVFVEKENPNSFIILKKDDTFEPAYIYAYCIDIKTANEVLDKRAAEAQFDGMCYINRKTFDVLEILNANGKIITYQIVEIKNNIFSD